MSYAFSLLYDVHPAAGNCLRGSSTSSPSPSTKHVRMFLPRFDSRSPPAEARPEKANASMRFHQLPGDRPSMRIMQRPLRRVRWRYAARFPARRRKLLFRNRGFPFNSASRPSPVLAFSFHGRISLGRQSMLRAPPVFPDEVTAMDPLAFLL